MRIAAVAVCAVVLVACASPTEPVIFSGTLEDPVGLPVAGATVVVEALEQVDVAPGAVPPVAFHAETTTNADGTFEFRFGLDERLRQLSRRNGGPLSFMASARVPERNLVWSFNFVREVGQGRWGDSTTPVRWRPVS